VALAPWAAASFAKMTYQRNVAGVTLNANAFGSDKMHLNIEELRIFKSALAQYSALSDERAQRAGYLMTRVQKEIDDLNSLQDFESDCGDACKL